MPEKLRCDPYLPPNVRQIDLDDPDPISAFEEECAIADENEPEEFDEAFYGRGK